MFLSQGEKITPAALLFDDQMPQPEALAAAAARANAACPDMGLPPTLRDAEKVLIMRALDHTEGNRTHAAKVLGISVRTLRNKLNEYHSKHGFAVPEDAEPAF